jgi:hypothetical protein
VWVSLFERVVNLVVNKEQIMHKLLVVTAVVSALIAGGGLPKPAKERET